MILKDGQVTMSVEQLYQIVFEAAGAASAPFMRAHPTEVFPDDEVTPAVRETLTRRGVPAPVGYR